MQDDAGTVADDDCRVEEQVGVRARHGALGEVECPAPPHVCHLEDGVCPPINDAPLPLHVSTSSVANGMGTVCWPKNGMSYDSKFGFLPYWSQKFSTCFLG